MTSVDTRPSPDLIARLLERAGVRPDRTLETLRQDASHRSYYRLAPDPGSGERSLVLCRDLPSPVPSDFIVLSEYLADRGLPVPRILSRDDGEGLLLLSDGGDSDLTDEITARTKRGEKESARKLLLRSLDLLVALHATPPVEPVSRRSFDFEKLHWEMEFLHDKIALLYPGRTPESVIPKEHLDFARNLCERLGEAGPRVFTHRDYHGKNILLPKEGDADRAPLTLVDYQDARMGLPWYDLASILYDPYTPLKRPDRREGYEYYTGHAGYDSGSAQTRELFLDQASQRLLKAMGSYFFLSLEKGMTDYARHIPVTLDLLDEIRDERGDGGVSLRFVEFVRGEAYPLLEKTLAESDS